MVDILDASGRPIRKQRLTESQSEQLGGESRVGVLPQTIGTHPSRGLTPAKLARILEQAEAGDLEAQLDLGEDMEEKDGHIYAELAKRRRALIGVPWSIEPPRNPTRQEEEATELVRELVADLEIEDLILDLADAIGKGFAAIEYDWARDGKTWMLDDAELRPQRWFQVAETADETIRLRDGSALGEDLIPGLWMVHRHKARSGHQARAVLHRILAWPYLFKNYSVRDLAEFLEIYGLPLRLGTYPPGASESEKTTLLKAVLNIGHSAAGIVPEGMQVDFKEAAEGRSDPFMAMIDWAERTQSKVILGQTLTSQADRGSNTNALGNVHAEVRQDIKVSDLRQIAQTLTRDLLWPLAALNTTVSRLRRAPRWVFDTQQPEDMKLFAESVPKLVQIGAQIPERWLHERLKIPEPEEGEAVLGVGNVPIAPARDRGRRRGGRSAALRVGGEGDDTPARQAQRLEAESNDAMTALIDEIRALVDQVESLDELAERLLELHPELDVSDLAEIIGDAFTAGNAAGRGDFIDELGGDSGQS